MSPEKGMCVYSQLHGSGNTLYVSPTTGICPLVCVSWIQTRLSATKHYYGSKGDLNWPESKQHAALDTLSMSNTLFENIKATIKNIKRSGLRYSMVWKQKQDLEIGLNASLVVSMLTSIGFVSSLMALVTINSQLFTGMEIDFWICCFYFVIDYIITFKTNNNHHCCHIFLFVCSIHRHHLHTQDLYQCYLAFSQVFLF